ncbi:MAG: hypothetical protein JNL88_03015 [Bacteroidia bacterium]|nr:hypothetical protein [Bacteroidia bacterium]
MLLRRHPDTQRDLIVLQITGQLFFICLGVLAVYYWKERQAFDAAHYLFEIIDRKFFFIAHHRPLGLVSQVLPVAGVWLGLPLKVIAILYSLGDILWYYFLFLWMAYGLESRRGVVSLLLLLSLTVRYSFFCPVTELLQGLALIPVWMSLLNKSFRFRLPLLTGLMVLIVFSHPLLFYPLAFAFAWWSLSRAEGATALNHERSRLPRILWPALVLISAAKFLLLDSYDHGKTFYPVVYNDYGYLKSLDFPAVWNHIRLIAAEYPLCGILFLATFFTYILRRKTALGLLLLFGLLGYLVLVTATHRFGAISNYSERILLPLPAMLAISAAGIMVLSRVLIPKLAAYVGLVLILLLHFDLLRLTARPYTLRVLQLESLCDAARETGIRKGIISEELMEQNSFAMTGWSYPLETLLISSYKGPDSSVTIALLNEHIRRIEKSGNSVRARQWIKWTEYILPSAELNSTYFRLPDENYLSLNEGHSSYTDTVLLHFHSAEKIRDHALVLAFDLETVAQKPLYCSDSTYLRITLPQGPELRLLLPYTVKYKTRLWAEIPVKELEENALVECAFLIGPKAAGTCLLRFSEGRLQAEKKP